MHQKKYIETKRMAEEDEMKTKRGGKKEGKKK